MELWEFFSYISKSRYCTCILILCRRFNHIIPSFHDVFNDVTCLHLLHFLHFFPINFYILWLWFDSAIRDALTSFILPLYFRHLARALYTCFIFVTLSLFFLSNSLLCQQIFSSPPLLFNPQEGDLLTLRPTHGCEHH